MRFHGVSTAGFGPFRNASLNFAPKFNVIYGPNESGKSTWHAALYAAFCGMRRSRGQNAADDEFMRQYRPWDYPGSWEVKVLLSLEDRRKIEMRQELIDRIDCRAIDVDLGRDYSNEIINEGSPDGALWLGLDRRSFISTACIKQTEMLEVLNNPEVLQTHLQRAAATCALNSTAAAALQLIETFRAENVGQDRANSTKPFRRAIQRVEALKKSLEIARFERLRYVDLVASENLRKSELERLRRELSLSRVLIADRDAKDWERRLERVHQILAAYPERPTADLDMLNELVRQVSTALRIWQERPAMPDVSGATASEIEAELGRLPSWPTGDIEPDTQVLKVESEYLAGKYALTLHTQAEPAQPPAPETAGFSADQLRQAASAMLEREPQVDTHLDEVCRNNPINERLIQRVHTALEVWDRRPSRAEVSIPTAEEIRQEINRVPRLPEGDLEPAAEIVDAANAHSSAKEAHRQHALSRPAEPRFPNLKGVAPSEIRTLAMRLREPAVTSGLDVKLRLRTAVKKEVEQLTKARTTWIGMTSGLSLLALIPLFALNELKLVVTAGTLGVVGIMVWLVSRAKSAPIIAKRQELEGLQQELDVDSSGANEWGRRQRHVVDRIEQLRLPSSPEALEMIANEFESAQDAERMYTLWRDTERRFESAVRATAQRLESLLSAKMTGRRIGDIDEAFVQYHYECTERSRIAVLASRRQDLERQLAAKVEAEASAAEINQRRNSADAELRQVAKLCKLTAATDEDLVRRLQEWLRECDRMKLLQAELGQQAFAKTAWKQRWLEVRDQLHMKGLPSNAEALRRLADDLHQADSTRAAYEQWSVKLSNLTQEHELQGRRVRQLLEGKGMEITGDLQDVLQQYRHECEARMQIANEARRRQDLERQLVTRRQAEEAAAQIYVQRQSARQELMAVAERCGVMQDDEVRLSENLREWRNSTSEFIRLQQEALKEWRELDTLLEARTYPEFKAKVQQHRDNAVVLGSPFSAEELDAAMPSLDEYEANLTQLTMEVESIGQDLANIQGQIHNYEERLMPVSDAEEELQMAEEELAKIRLLDETLDATHVFLRQAQDRIHKDIAPFLAEAMKRWLPDVTMGRYVDAKVDPETLHVQVRELSGKWRDSTLLSHGTAEQIYLLLRLALAEYLTKPTEVCPLILDEVTVQSDVKRKERMLATLKAVSKTRQVILFTQEEDVLQWAKKNLSEPEGRTIELTPVND